MQQHSVPKGNKEDKILLYACRNCDHQEVADNNCVYRNEIHHSVGERTQILQDVAADPTLPRTKAVRCAQCKHGEAVFFQFVRSEMSSVVKLELGFSARDLGFDLNQIAQGADTSTYKGLCYVFNGNLLNFAFKRRLLLRFGISIVTILVPYLWCQISVSRYEANNHIEKLSLEERIKNIETLVNVNGNRKLQRPTSQKSANDLYNVDIMVLDGGLSFPKTICNKYDLEKVLHELRSVGASICLINGSKDVVMDSSGIFMFGRDKKFVSEEGLASMLKNQLVLRANVSSIQCMYEG
ncbi:hypothetical protein ACLB2K_039882 [Fragaria x ananassa]